ncbi:hypothetical protein [Sediminibacillus terrae]|uniref:hypothetical protein n=1 Tax=Sediminibacillus terrae TaxID=1562106 RepID=UPI001296B6AE|nr:hypothetical protein [Sediminibacillus terrae]
MKVRKYLFLIMVLLLLVANNPFQVLAAESSGTATVSGVAGVSLTQKFTDEENKEFGDKLEDIENKVENVEYKNKKVSRFYPAIDGLVKINGEPVTVNDHGEFNLDVEPGKYIVEFEDGVSCITKKINIKEGETIDLELIKERNFKKFIDSMDKNHKNKKMEESSNGNMGHHDSNNVNTEQNDEVTILLNDPISGDHQIDEIGEKGRTGAFVHCNRFNGDAPGISQDETYYSSSTYQAFRNFIGSDCDKAMVDYGCVSIGDMGPCQGLHHYQDWINTNIQNCSLEIGHGILYHSH